MFWCGLIYLGGSLKQSFAPFGLKISSRYANDYFLRKVFTKWVFFNNTVMNVYGYQSRIYLPVLKLYQKVD